MSDFKTTCDISAICTDMPLSKLQVTILHYEETSSQVLRKRNKKAKQNLSLTYACKEKRKSKCKFCLKYTVDGDFATFCPEKSNLEHSHTVKQATNEMDFEYMRRCFKVIEKKLWKILAKNDQTSPKHIFEMLLQDNGFDEKMLFLEEKYPKKFKKSLDNQVNKIKRKMIKAQNSNTITFENSYTSLEGFSSFLSEETTTILRFLKEDKENPNESTVIKSQEDELELRTLTPIVFY